MTWAMVAMVTYGYGAVVALWNAHLLRRFPNALSLAWALVGGMCILFCVAWGFVVFDDDLDRSQWSEVVSPGSALFPVIFTLPALILSVAHRRDE